MSDDDVRSDGREIAGGQNCVLTGGSSCGISVDCLDSDQLDKVLTVLSDRRQRWLLYHLWVENEPVIERVELAEVIQTAEAVDGEDPPQVERVVRDLHHWVLPKLADRGFISYDPRHGTVRYEGQSEVEELVAHTYAQEQELTM